MFMPVKVTLSGVRYGAIALIVYVSLLETAVFLRITLILVRMASL